MLPRIALIAGITLCAFAPPAWSGPPSSQRTLSCNDGSVFTVVYVSPETASGINSTFKISNASGPAADAKAFAVKFRTIYDQNGAIVFASGAKGPGNHRNLVTCTFASVGNSGYTVEDVGFYVAPGRR